MNKFDKKPWKFALVLSLLLVLGFAINVVAAMPDQTEVQSILDKYCELLNNGDVDAMMNYVVDMRQTPEESKKLYKSLLEDNSEVLRSVEVNKVSRLITKNGLSIVADATVTFRDGHSQRHPLYFKQFQGQWKLFVPSQGEASPSDL